MGGAELPVIGEALSKLGLGTIGVIAVYYLIKYFMGKLDQKDERIKELTVEYVSALKAIVSDNTSAMNELRDAVRGLTSPVTGPRSTDIVTPRRQM